MKKTNMSAILGLMELFYMIVLEKNNVSCWNEFILVIDNRGWKVKQG